MEQYLIGNLNLKRRTDRCVEEHNRSARKAQQHWSVISNSWI